jgi:hypothetical protein
MKKMRKLIAFEPKKSGFPLITSLKWDETLISEMSAKDLVDRIPKCFSTGGNNEIQNS